MQVAQPVLAGGAKFEVEPDENVVPDENVAPDEHVSQVGGLKQVVQPSDGASVTGRNVVCVWQPQGEQLHVLQADSMTGRATVCVKPDGAKAVGAKAVGAKVAVGANATVVGIGAVPKILREMRPNNRPGYQPWSTVVVCTTTGEKAICGVAQVPHWARAAVAETVATNTARAQNEFEKSFMDRDLALRNKPASADTSIYSANGTGSKKFLDTIGQKEANYG